MIYLFFILLQSGYLETATIGDGRTSLITGKAANFASDTCNVNGQYYASETTVPRDHPCHYCICYAGQVDCFWKKCANIPQNCQVFSFENTCNPSLYICTIPENARNPPSSSAATATLRSTVTTTTVQSTTTPFRPSITPPSRHLTLPERSAPVAQSRSISTSENKMPAQFGLRMKQKKRFRRSLPIHQRLPLDEPFPIQFDEEFVANLEREIRHKRSINGSSSSNHDHDHHHHHHHDEPIDRGCTILGVRYELGEVIGIATDICQECRCAAQSLYCSPKCCFKPAPLEISSHLVQVYEDTKSSLSNEASPQHPLYYVEGEFL